MTRGLWTRETVALMLLAAYLPLGLFWLWFGSVEAVQRLALVALILCVWHLVFLLARAQPLSFSVLVSAFAVTVLAPEGMGLFQLALGVSFGAVMGELVFGGWGRNVVNPATVVISFLGFGFPGHTWPAFVEPVAWAAIPTAVLGVAAGVFPAPVVLGAVLVAGATVAGNPARPLPQ